MTVNLVPENPDEPMPVEIIEQAIVDIAAAMERIEKTRLTRKAIILLIHDHTKLARRDIGIVLDNLGSLERIWLKPKAAKGAKA